MEDSVSNNTLNSSGAETCRTRPGDVIAHVLIDLFTFVIGQPVTVKLLWMAITSRKSTDILNCNLALFNNTLYLMCLFNFIFSISMQQRSNDIQGFLLVYTQIGGPMGLSFICLERYVAVIHPTFYPLLKKYRFREVGAMAMWLSSVSIATATVLAKDTLSCLTEMVLKSMPISVMVLMTILMMWCSGCIMRALQRSGPGQDKLHPVKKKASFVVRGTATINLLCYIPVTMLQKFKFFDECAFKLIIMPICIFLLCVASVVHPLFYLSTQRKLLLCSKERKKAEAERK